MVREKKAKTASLALVALCLALSLAQTIATVPYSFPQASPTVPAAFPAGPATVPAAFPAGPATVPCGFPQGLVAIHPGCALLPRLLYSFFHASLLHCLINSWCLLSVVFYYNLPLSSLLISYLIAATFPVDHLSFVIYHLSFSEAPTVGLSGICFALMAQASFHARRKLFFHAWIAGFLLVSSLLPLLCSACGYAIASPNTSLHIYCYVVGLMVGFLNSPAPWQRK